MNRAIFALFTATYTTLAGAQSLDGRIVDILRNPLPGVKLTWSPWGVTAPTGAEGRFHLGFANPVRPPLRLPPAAGPVGKVRADGRWTTGSESPWTRWFPSRPESQDQSAAVAPLAKTAVQSLLTAEKDGYATARIVVPENAVSLPDIILAMGPSAASLQGQLAAMPIHSAPAMHFESGTSTDLPDVYNEDDPIDPRTDGPSIFSIPSRYIEVSNPLYAAVHWSLATLPGITATIRAHTAFPDSLGKPEQGPEFKADEDGRLQAFIEEEYALFYKVGGFRSVSPHPYGDTVTMILKGPSEMPGFATMKWLQFLGPVLEANKYLAIPSGETVTWSTRIYGYHSGPVPPLDTCGRLSGRIEWKGPGSQPELWIGMLGTDLFAQVDADGGFLSTDLPPGILPLAVVRVERDSNGKVTSKAFYNLDGISVSPGQVSLLDPLELAGP